MGSHQQEFVQAGLLDGARNDKMNADRDSRYNNNMDWHRACYCCLVNVVQFINQGYFVN
jgi:hypothetical protein